MADALEQLNGFLAGRFQVERAIGSGGMATVYLARDLRHGRSVALKVLRRDIAASLGTDRFRREIAIAATLTHPNILPLFDSAADDSDAGDRDLFFVMPFVDGETVRARLGTGPLPIDDAIRIAIDVANALDYAHRQGIVHRDIKPENILLLDGHGVVTDFGIAHALSEAGAERLTQTGVLLGTPAYMSPEQASGDRSIDGRSDLFSLASVLYEMLAGTSPFSAPTLGATLTRIATGAPAPIRSVRPETPAELASALDRALAKNPDARFTTGGDFARALQRSRVTGTPRHRRVGRLAAIVVASAALVALAALLLRQSRGASTSAALPSLAVLPFTSESGDTADSYLGRGMADELITALTDLPGVRVASRTSSFAVGPAPDVRAIGRHLGVTALLEGSLRRSGGAIRVSARLVDAEHDTELWGASFDGPTAGVFETQEAIARAIVDRLRIRLTRNGEIVRRRTQSPEAHDLVLRARNLNQKDATSASLEEISLLERALAIDSTYAEAYAELASVLQRMAVFRDQGQLSGAAGMEASEMLRRARVAAERAVQLDSLSSAAHMAYGSILFRFDWRWADAEREMRRAIDLNPSAGEPYRPYSRFLRSMGRFDEARRALDSAAARTSEADAGSRRGAQYGRIDYFEKKYAQAIQTTLRDPRLDTVRTAPTWLAQAYIGLRRYSTAESLLALPAAMHDPARSRTLAYIYALTGQSQRARSELAGRDPTIDLPTHAAGVYLVLGDTAQAIEELRRAIAIRDPLVVDMRVSPWLDPLRGNPQFKALMAQLHFPP